jgi:hypothetical protein
MSGTKLGLVALLASLALSGGGAASSAWAGEWFIGGTKLAAGQTAAVATAAVLDKPFIFASPSVSLLIECQGSTSVFKSSLLTAGKMQGEAITYSSCVLVSAPPGCGLSQSSIEMNPYEATVTTGTSPADKITFKPLAGGKRLLEIRFTGETCSIEGLQGVIGSVTAKLPAGQTEAATQVMEWQGSTENNSLEGALSKVYLESGKSLIKLASGSKWSFH